MKTDKEMGVSVLKHIISETERSDSEPNAHAGDLLCPVCGEKTQPKVYGPFFAPDPVRRFAMTCPNHHWRGRMCATREEAEGPVGSSEVVSHSPVYRLMVSYDCGCSYHESMRSTNSEDFVKRIEECERDVLRWCIETEQGDITHVSSIHRNIIATMEAIKANV